MTRFKTIFGILFLLLIATVHLAQAQEPQEPPTPVEPAEDTEAEPSAIVFGMKGGVNVGWLRNDDDKMDERIGFAAGAFVATRSEGLLGYQVEFLYSSRGYKTGSRAVAIDYVEMPVLAKLNLPKLGSMRLSVVGGAAPGLRVRTKYGSARSSTQDDFKADVNRFDVAAIVGAVLSIPMGQGAVEIEGRYSIGLLPVFVDKSQYSNGDDRNRAYMGLIGYRF